MVIIIDNVKGDGEFVNAIRQVGNLGAETKDWIFYGKEINTKTNL